MTIRYISVRLQVIENPNFNWPEYSRHIIFSNKNSSGSFIPELISPMAQDVIRAFFSSCAILSLFTVSLGSSLPVVPMRHNMICQFQLSLVDIKMSNNELVFIQLLRNEDHFPKITCWLLFLAHWPASHADLNQSCG